MYGVVCMCTYIYYHCVGCGVCVCMYTYCHCVWCSIHAFIVIVYGVVHVCKYILCESWDDHLRQKHLGTLFWNLSPRGLSFSHLESSYCTWPLEQRVPALQGRALSPAFCFSLVTWSYSTSVESMVFYVFTWPCVEMNYGGHSLPYSFSDPETSFEFLVSLDENRTWVLVPMMGSPWGTLFSSKMPW